MAALKLILVTIGFLLFIAGFMYVSFVLLKKNKSQSASCSSETSETRSFGCGCGTGACGLP